MIEPTVLTPQPPALASRRHSAVLLLLYEVAGETWLILTRRTETVPNHKGQISLPGGVYRPEDGSVLETALRETREEIGLDPAAVEIVGALDPVATLTSNFEIYPFIGRLPGRPPLHANPREVEDIIEVRLADLATEASRRLEWREVDGRSTAAFSYEVGPDLIWGATARILGQFLDRVSDFGLVEAVGKGRSLTP